MKTIQLRKILVPIDFSRGSVKALRLAAEIAGTHHASIQLLYVQDDDYDLYPLIVEKKSVQFAELTNRLAELARSVIDQFNIKCVYTAQYGSVTHCILKAAVHIHADLIVLGQNGSNGRGSGYAGTHCCQVAEKSVIPILIVPEQTTNFTLENILFPVRPLLSMPGKYDAVRNLFINKPLVTILNLRNPYNDDELHIIHKLTQLITSKMKADRVKYTMEYYFKDNGFADHVINSIRREMYDLAIVSSDTDEARLDFHIGHYVQKIIHNTTIPLLVLQSRQSKMTSFQILQALETEYGVLN